MKNAYGMLEPEFEENTENPGQNSKKKLVMIYNVTETIHLSK